MWGLIIILGMIGFVNFLFTLSILEKKRFISIYSLIISVLLMFLYPFTVKLNFFDVKNLLTQHTIITGLSALEIAQLIFSAFFVLGLIEIHYNGNKSTIKNIGALLPSVFFVIALFVLQNWIFNNIGEISFFYLALIFSVALFIVLVLLTIILKMLIKEWKSRLEIKMLVSFFQMVSVMMLPIFLVKINLNLKNVNKINPIETIIVLGLILVGVFIGIINYKYQLKEKLWKYLTK